MTDAELALARIEAITDEIEALQAALGISANQPSDHEAHDVAARICRQMARNRTREAAE